MPARTVRQLTAAPELAMLAVLEAALHNAIARPAQPRLSSMLRCPTPEARRLCLRRGACHRARATRSPALLRLALAEEPRRSDPFAPLTLSAGTARRRTDYVRLGSRNDDPGVGRFS
jgi:hypothetical protein